MQQTALAAAALSLALAIGGAQAQTPSKPSAQAAASTSAVSLPPTVTFENLSIGRRMIVNLAAPRTDATLGRPADVHQVVLRSDNWYCERQNVTVSTGAFASQIRTILEGYLAGNYRPPPDVGFLANAPDLDAFAANVLAGSIGGASNNTRFKVTSTLDAGAAELRLNDCYTASEMQAIKDEVARVLGRPN